LKRLAFAVFVTFGLLFGFAHPGGAATGDACAITVFPIRGAYVATPHLHGPGLLLDGGGGEEAPQASVRWMHRQLVGSDRRGGNVVVIRASYTDADDVPFWGPGIFASVQTILIPPCAPPSAVNAAAPIVDRADAVFWAGGDQSHYVAWKNTALVAAVRRVYARNGIVGGGSAGLAIQGAAIYDAVAADVENEDTDTADAVANPLETRISFTTGFFAWPPLADTITDTHFVVRNRFGRSVAFIARIIAGHLLGNVSAVYALGVDQASSVGVGPDGMATLFNGPGGAGAYLLRGKPPAALLPNQPLNYTVDVAHISRNGERFDLLHKTTPRPWYPITVNGAKRPFYSSDPYRH
jgi:cyanophycinase-like exopeptidase